MLHSASVKASREFRRLLYNDRFIYIEIMYLSVLILEEENNKYKHICKIKYPISYFKNLKILKI